LNDKEATIQQFNKFYRNENIFFYIQVPRRRMHVDVAPRGVVPTREAVGDGTNVN
jgi:hypothetical protein